MPACNWPAEVGATPRLALYFAPAVESPWWRFGSSWLGRDAFTLAASPPPSLEGLEGIDHPSTTAVPRRYGFHATLVAPFMLREDVAAEQLHARVSALARSLRTLQLGRLEPARLGTFVALLPTADSAPIAELARTCVLCLDPVRAPLSQREFARRARDQDAHGIALVHRHGYAFVLDRFRFHMTLTGEIDLPRQTGWSWLPRAWRGP